jgi:hypothetical protein
MLSNFWYEGDILGIKAGAAKVDITPPIGVELSGYGYYLKRKSTSISDRLYSKALVLSDGTNCVAMAANDLIGINRETTRQVRDIVTRETGIPKGHILVSCSHTHHGPATIFLRGCGEIDKEYLAILPKYIAGSIIQANKNLQNAKIGSGSGSLDDFSYNRSEEGGLTDPEVGVIRVDNVKDKPIAILTNFSCHPVVNPINNALSSDFPGRTTSIIETIKKGSIGMFLQGAPGDIKPFSTWSGKVENAGVRLAAETLKAGERIDMKTEATISSKTQKLELPLNIMSVDEIRKMLNEYIQRVDSSAITSEEKKIHREVYEEYAESLLRKIEAQDLQMETEIQVIRIGDILLVANPSETFVKFCLEVKERSPHRTFLVGYANDYVGYITTKKDIKRKGYSSTVGPVLTDNFPFKSNIGRFLVDEILNLIQRLAQPLL